MAQVKIIVKNASGDKQRFLIFNDKPTGPQQVGQVWNNVWADTPLVGSEKGSVTFTIEEKYYAVCGKDTRPLENGLVVKTTDHQEVSLAVEQKGGTAVPLIISDGGVVFDKDHLVGESTPGSYGIHSDASNGPEYKNVFCGIGMKSPIFTDRIVPVSVWQAEPNQKYTITPRRVYYISMGDYKPGRLVDPELLGTFASVDFTGRDSNVATLTLTKSLEFLPPVYSRE